MGNLLELPKIELRDYQHDAIDGIEGCVMFDEKEIVLFAETSFGKSITAAGICQRLSDKRIAIVVNIESLIDQIAAALDSLEMEYSILKAGKDNHFDPKQRIQLIMSQTYDARSNKIDLWADIIIQDEIHKEFDTKRTKKIKKGLKADTRIGLSATPWDQDGFALKNATMVNTISCNELTERGYLAPIKYYIPRWAERVNYSSVKKSGNDYSMQSMDDVIGTDAHIQKVITAMNQMNAKNKKTLIFCSTIEQCDRIEAALLKAGYNAAAYHSNKSSKENERIMNSFKYNLPYAGSDEEIRANTLFSEDIFHEKNDRVITALASVSKLTTGFSVEDIDLGIGGRPTKIKSLWHQIPGRIRRTYYKLNELINKYQNIKEPIAFIASYYNEVDKIKAQLKKQKITNISVFPYLSEPEGYAFIEKNVRPNKEYGEFVDLGQCISLHGFPEDPYNPPVKTYDEEKNKELLDEALIPLRLEHLDVILPDNDKPTLITRESYEMKIQEIKSNNKKLSDMTTKEISAKMEFEEDPVVLIAMLAVLFDKIHGTDIQDDYGRYVRGYVDKKGKRVINFVNGDSIGWMSELWVEKLKEQDGYHRRKYLKAFRTRAKNMLREKASIWAIRFFIEWLIEQDNIIMEQEVAYENNQYPDIDIDEMEIPF